MASVIDLVLEEETLAAQPDAFVGARDNGNIHRFLDLKEHLLFGFTFEVTGTTSINLPRPFKKYEETGATS